ncbi:MAG: LysM peptidoglycan-binding domain-containing protein [Terriglobia bacterium]
MWARALPTAVLAVLPLLPSVAMAAQQVWCHRVRRGDTLATLARRYGNAVQKLRTLNSLSPDDILRVAHLLTLPRFVSLRRGHLKLGPEPLTAAAGNLERENAEADRQDLSRMRNLGMVRPFLEASLLVRVPAKTPT